MENHDMRKPIAGIMPVGFMETQQSYSGEWDETRFVPNENVFDSHSGWMSELVDGLPEKLEDHITDGALFTRSEVLLAFDEFVSRLTFVHYEEDELLSIEGLDSYVPINNSQGLRRLAQRFLNELDVIENGNKTGE